MNTSLTSSTGALTINPFPSEPQFTHLSNGASGLGFLLAPLALVFCDYTL